MGRLIRNCVLKGLTTVIAVSVLLTGLQVSGRSLKSDNVFSTALAAAASAPKVSSKTQGELDKANADWMNSFNKNSGDVEKYYSKNALLFPGSEQYLKGAKNIAAYYKKLYKETAKISKVSPEARVMHTGAKIYETGTFQSEKKVAYQYLISWSKVKGVWTRDIEAVAKKASKSSDFSKIDEARDKWIKLANAHSAKKLITEVYESKCIYYCNGFTAEGHTSLTSAYSYMNDPNYKVNLEAISKVMVKDNLAYEIGEWKMPGGGKGKYIIVWRKQSDATWKIYLDSNF